MTDRELMQMALDALDWKLTTLLKKSWENHHIHEVVKALRDRLAQPEREWVGLTEEEAWDMLAQMSIGASIEDIRFVEAKLKDKNVSHVGCFSYPNCDIDPNGCVVRNGDKAEQYGFKD